MTILPFDQYYRYVKLRLFSIIVVLPLLTILSGCDRGAHPAQMNIAAPDFTVSDGTTSVHLASYRGKVVLLNFWQTTCAPCVAELPSLMELQHDRPDLTVLAIATDEDNDAYTRFLNRHRITLLTVHDPAQTSSNLYHTDMWPETYVIDRKGMIRRKFIGAQDWSNPEVRAFLQNL